MKERETEQLETLSPEDLLEIEERLNLLEFQGQDVTEAREELWKLFNKKMGASQDPELVEGP